MTAPTVNMAAPGGKANYSVQAQSGNQYVSDAYGVISGVPIGDIDSLYKAACIPLGQSGARSTFSQTADPTVSNDNTQDYGVGSTWFNTSTGIEWHCISAATGAAVWVPAVSTGMLLGRIIGANMNVTTDQAFVLTNYAALNAFRITKITAKNASISLTTAAGGVYPAASKGGTAIVASSQAYSSLSSSALALDLTLAAGTTVYAKGGTPILSLSTGQGAAATADLYLFGDIYN
jgi:hypothetical protein